MPDQPTPAELMRAVEAARGDVLGLRAELREYTTSVHQLVTRMTVVERELEQKRHDHDRDLTEVKADISELKEWQTWAIRIVLAVVVAAVLGVALTIGDRVP